MSLLGVEWVMGIHFFNFETATDGGRFKKTLRIPRQVPSQRVHRVIAGIHRPDNFVQRCDQVPAALRYSIQSLAVTGGRHRGFLKQAAQQADFSQPRSEVVVQILGDARPLALEIMLVLQLLQPPANSPAISGDQGK